MSGGVVGALAGAAVGFLAVWIRPDWIHPPTGAFIGLMFGAPLGAALFPLAGWLLMRRVALGRALLRTAVGTIVGGLAGWFLPLRYGDTVTQVLTGGVVGFLIAVLVLRRSVVASDVDAVATRQT